MMLPASFVVVVVVVVVALLLSDGDHLFQIRPSSGGQHGRLEAREPERQRQLRVWHGALQQIPQLDLRAVHTEQQQHHHHHHHRSSGGNRGGGNSESNGT